jgi:lipopolysaccharide export system protein LptA
MKITILLARGTQAPEQIDIEGLRRLPAVIESIDPAAGRRMLSAVDLHAGFNHGVVALATARGNVRLVEKDAAGAAQRTATASVADAVFDATGELVRIELEGKVELAEAEVTAKADHATIDDRQRRTLLRADPWVEIVGAQGTLLAPVVTYSHETGWLEAEGGVRASLITKEGTALGPLAASDSEDPVRVESGKAVLQETTGEFVFTGAARAWQGESRLTGEQIRGNQNEDRLAASGGVETHWRSVAAPQKGSEEAEEQPVRISADHFDYSGADSKLIYEGTVIVQQVGRALRCEHLTVDLDDNQDAERMDCRTNAVLEDPSLKRKVSGQRALYYPKIGEVVITPPLKLEEPNRSIDSPQRLWYRFEDGVFELGPNAPDPERGG